MRFNSAVLPPEQLGSLLRLASRTSKSALSHEHRESLTRAGLAECRAGLLSVTMLGRAKLAIEITRCSWREAGC